MALSQRSVIVSPSLFPYRKYARWLMNFIFVNSILQMVKLILSRILRRQVTSINIRLWLSSSIICFQQSPCSPSPRLDLLRQLSLAPALPSSSTRFYR